MAYEIKLLRMRTTLSLSHYFFYLIDKTHTVFEFSNTVKMVMLFKVVLKMLCYAISQSENFFDQYGTRGALGPQKETPLLKGLFCNLYKHVCDSDEI